MICFARLYIGPQITCKPISRAGVFVLGPLAQLFSVLVSVPFSVPVGQCHSPAPKSERASTHWDVLAAFADCAPLTKGAHGVGGLPPEATFPGTGLPSRRWLPGRVWSRDESGADGPKGEQGQGLVEFALILPILLLTTLLFIYFAQLFNTWSGLQAGAVAGARQASDTGSVTGVEAAVRDALEAHTVDPADVQITATVLNADGSPKTCWVEPCPVEFGDLVVVEVVKPFDIEVLNWRTQGKLPASHQVRAQHGVWSP